MAMNGFDENYGPAWWNVCEALDEGWELFETDHDEGGQLTIQTLADYATPFATDDDAVAYVQARAAAGSELHKRAMALHLNWTWRP